MVLFSWQWCGDHQTKPRFACCSLWDSPPRSLFQEDPILTPTEPQPRHLFHLHDSTCMIYSRGHLITQLPRFEKCPQGPVIGQTDSRAARLEGSMSDRNLRYHRSSSIFPWAFWIRTWFTAGWMPRHPRDSNAGPIANSKNFLVWKEQSREHVWKRM